MSNLRLAAVLLINYENSPIVNINGDLLKIVGKTRNGQGVYTENFVTVYGVLAYDSLVPVNNNTLSIYQFNAVTEQLLAQALLTCNFYGNGVALSKVINYPIFKSIKADAIKSEGMPFNR